MRHDTQHIMELICVTNIQRVPIKYVSGTVPGHQGWGKERHLLALRDLKSLEVFYVFPLVILKLNGQPTSNKHPFFQKNSGKEEIMQ